MTRVEFIVGARLRAKGMVRTLIHSQASITNNQHASSRRRPGPMHTLLIPRSMLRALRSWIPTFAGVTPKVVRLFVWNRNDNRIYKESAQLNFANTSVVVSFACPIELTLLRVMPTLNSRPSPRLCAYTSESALVCVRGVTENS
jgi:hypothetical protein